MLYKQGPSRTILRGRPNPDRPRASTVPARSPSNRAAADPGPRTQRGEAAARFDIHPPGHVLVNEPGLQYELHHNPYLPNINSQK